MENLWKSDSFQHSQDTATDSWSEAPASIFRSWTRRFSCVQNWKLHLLMLLGRPLTLVIWLYPCLDDCSHDLLKTGPFICHVWLPKCTGPAILTQGGKSWYILIPFDDMASRRKVDKRMDSHKTTEIFAMISCVATFRRNQPKEEQRPQHLCTRHNALNKNVNMSVLTIWYESRKRTGQILL